MAAYDWRSKVDCSKCRKTVCLTEEGEVSRKERCHRVKAKVEEDKVYTKVTVHSDESHEPQLLSKMKVASAERKRHNGSRVVKYECKRPCLCCIYIE